MRALIVYESIWGNTKLVAHAVDTGLKPTMSVDVFDTETAPHDLDDYDLVVVGGPTHAFSMSRRATREAAVKSNGAPSAPSRGIREWLESVTPPAHAIPAAAFDTRVDAPRLPGSAARAARHELRSLGFDVTSKAESFRVHDYEGPLIEGELERATAWAVRLCAIATAIPVANS